MILLKDKWQLGKIFYIRRIGFDRIFKIECTTTKILSRHLNDKKLMEEFKEDDSLNFYNDFTLKSYRVIDNKDFLVNNCVSSDLDMQVLIGKDWEIKYNKTNK